MKRRIIAAGLVVTGLFMSLSANAAFFGVLPATPGETDWLAYYDDQLDITWTEDGNINDLSIWTGQTTWAADLTISGVTDWRLPSMDVNGDDTLIDCASDTQAACMDNEYGHFFHYGAGTTLGGGITFASPGVFSNVGTVSNSQYWSSTEHPVLATAGHFNMANGAQSYLIKLSNGPAWAVHDGNPGNAVVPVPAAVWLFGSALGLLGWIRRKKAS